MLENEVLKDVRMAFIFSATLKEDDGKIWNETLEYCDEGYYWHIKEDQRKIFKTKNILSSALEDYILVENFYLSKQLFHVGRDYSMISRFIPSIDLELIFPIKSKDESPIKVKPTVILSLYRDMGVVTLILNVLYNEIGTDDLIYIKSLKWNSIKHYKGAPKIRVFINGIDKGEQYFFELLKILFNEVFKNKLKIGTESESILDLIEIRDKEIGEQLFCGKRNDLLYGLLAGDEGYIFSNIKITNEYFTNPDRCIENRTYFKYFFAPTSILGLFSKDYPKFNKEEFAKFYAKKYYNFEPLCQYINLVSDIANLSDGLAFVGEIILVRHTLLKEVDLNIRNEFEEREMDFKHLLRLKREIIIKLTKIELLANDVLWINLLFTTDDMFGYKSINKNIKERLEYIDNQIRDEYNARVQNRLFVLTIIITILTIIMALPLILNWWTKISYSGPFEFMRKYFYDLWQILFHL